MDQQNPNDPKSGPSGLNPGSSGSTTGSGGTVGGGGYASGGTGTGMSSGGGMTTGSGGSGAPIGVTSGSDADTFGTSASGNSGVGGFSSSGSSSAGTTGSGTDTADEFCAHCGHALGESKGLEQFLGRLGISGEMFSNLKGQFQNVDIDEYLNTAREYLKGSTSKATTYTKENPAKVAAGVAALALGAGLIYAAVNRDKGDTATASTGTAGFDATPDPNVNLNRGGDFDRDREPNRGYDPNRT